MPINIPGLSDTDLLYVGMMMLGIDGTCFEVFSHEDCDAVFMWNDESVVSVAIRGDGTWGLSMWTGELRWQGDEYMVYFGI